MSIEDIIENQFQALETETEKAMEDVQVYQRQLFLPIWEKRREMTKKIANFWGTTIGNCPIFGDNASENDVEALENLVDFHVEFDKANPKHRKVIATFKKNRVFKNETLSKEFTVDINNGGSVVSKSTIDYHAEKKTNKRKAQDLEDDLLSHSFLEWFEDEDVDAGLVLTDDIFPNAVDYYKGQDEDDEDDEDDEEIDLDSEEEEVPKPKKSKK